MPIPYKVSSEITELGTAGFIKVEEKSGFYRGALFLIDCRGEPVEFTYTDIRIPNTFLWNKNEIARGATRRIITSLFGLCPQVPRLILCLGTEITAKTFCEDIETSIPVCRVVESGKECCPHEREKILVDPQNPQLRLVWCPEIPIPGTAGNKLFYRLSNSGLLVEPFQRITRGLIEVYDKPDVNE